MTEKQSSSTPHRKLQHNRTFMTWFVGLILLASLAVGLSFWSVAKNRKMANRINELEQKAEENARLKDVYTRLAETDQQVIIDRDYNRAIENYTELLSEFPESEHGPINLRIEQLENLMEMESDRDDMAVNNALLRDYKNQLEQMEQRSDSLRSALVAQSGALNEEIETLQNRINRKDRELARKENIQVLSFPSGNNGRVHYLGEVEDGKANGGGVGIWSTGSVYRGDWKNNQRHGEGTFEWADGEVYEGTFVNDRREGHGIYRWPSGERYEGEWVDNRRTGQGTLYDLDGNIRYEGKWKDDKPVE